MPPVHSLKPVDKLNYSPKSTPALKVMNMGIKPLELPFET